MATETIEGAAPAKHRYIGPVFDGDTHLYETPDAFSRYMPKEYAADWQLHYKVGDDGKFALYVGPRKVEISADYMTEDQRIPPPGKLHEWLRAQKEGKSEVDMRVPISAEMTDPAERVKYLDKWNVRSSLLYCGNFVSAISYLDEIKPAYAVLEAYNRWMLDQWTFNYHDRFWAIVNEAKLRVIFHVSEAIYMKHHMAVWGEPVQQSRLRQTAFVWMHGYSERPVIETLSSFVFWNFFERFPNIKLVSAENGAEWVPAMLVKMDKCRGMAKNGFWPAGQLKERPSKIFMKNIMVVAYPEDDIASIVEQTGNADWLLMGTDYPHSEGVPEPHDFADEACTNLSDEDTRKVMYENGMKLMGYPL